MLSRRDDTFQTLVVHFSHRFFDTDTPSEESVPRNRLIQFLALIAVASPLLMILVIYGMQGIQLRIGGFDLAWLQAGIHYALVCYSMAVMGLVMTFSWDSLFLDKRDYLILGSLPISAKRLFAAKAVAVAVILLLFAVATNVVLAVFVLFMEPRALLGHVVGVLGGAVFAALFFTAVQGILISLLPVNVFRRISASIQQVSMALLLLMILVMPLLALSLRPLTLINSALLDYFPPAWFLGIYESLSFSPSAVPKAGVWAWTAVKMMTLVLLMVAISYGWSYRRHSRKVLESVDTNDLLPSAWNRIGATLLREGLHANAFQHAAFDFIGKISNRSSKHRVSSALYSGLGLALAMSAIFVIRPREAFPIGLSMSGILQAPAALSFLVVVGWRATFGIPYELPANWIFQMTSRAGAKDFRKAIRKWLFVCRIVPLYLLLASFELAWFDWRVAVTHLIFDLVTTAFLIEILFFGFPKVPFTCAYLQRKLQLAFYAVAYLIAYSTYTTMMVELKQWIVADPLHLMRFLAVSAIVLGVILIYRSITSAETSRFVYEEAEPTYQQLKLT
jgi:hypothetical protein